MIPPPFAVLRRGSRRSSRHRQLLRKHRKTKGEKGQCGQCPFRLQREKEKTVLSGGDRLRQYRTHTQTLFPPPPKSYPHTLSFPFALFFSSFFLFFPKIFPFPVSPSINYQFYHQQQFLKFKIIDSISNSNLNLEGKKKRKGIIQFNSKLINLKRSFNYIISFFLLWV